MYSSGRITGHESTIQHGQQMERLKAEKSGFPFSVTTTVTGILFFLVIIIILGTALASDVSVIANKGVTQSNISPTALKAIFLGQTTTWADGTRVECAVLKDSDPTHRYFLKRFIKKSAAQFNSYWKQQLFTGKNDLPRQFDSDTQMISYVATTKGAIGYVSSETARGGAVKVLSINE